MEVLVIRGTRNRKVNVQDEDERKEVILPHRKVGFAGEYKKAGGEVYLQGRNVKLQAGQLLTNRGKGETEPDGCSIRRKVGFEGLSRLSKLTWHGVRVNQDKGDKTKNEYRSYGGRNIKIITELSRLSMQ